MLNSSESETYKIIDGTFTSSIDEKVHIYYLHYLPRKKLTKKIKHIIFQHGMIEYHHRHIELFEALLAKFDNSIVVSAMDLVGHGRSGGHRAYIEKFKNYTDDSINFLKICNEKFYQAHEVETIYITHSLGGLVLINLLTNEENELPFSIDKCIFVNPAIAPKLKVPKKVKNTVENVNPFISQFKVPVIYDAYDLTHDLERAMSFMHDHLISKSVSFNLVSQMLKVSKDLIKHSYFFNYPSLFLLSGDDRLVDNERTQLFITGMDKKNVNVKKYKNMRHDLLNETCRTDVFEVIINYIKKGKI